METPMYAKLTFWALSFAGFITWIAILMTAAKIYKFFVAFEKFKSKNDIELNSVVWTVKKLEGHMLKIISELQVSNKLLYEIARDKFGKSIPQDNVKYNLEDSLRHKKKNDSDGDGDVHT